MSTSINVVSYGAIGPIAIPTAFAAPTSTVSIGKLAGCALYAKVVTDAASNFTSVDLEIVDSLDASAGSWIPNTIVATASAGTVTYGSGSNNTIANVTVSAGTTYWIKLLTPNTIMSPTVGASIRGNGGAAKSGDVVTLYFRAYEGA